MTATSVAPALPWAASSALCENTEQQGEQQEGVQLVACNVEALGLKVGDKIEVKWHIESEGAEPYYKWWKATIVKCADSSEASTSSPQYELLYEAHEGFEQETAIVKFHSDRELQDVTQPTALLWRKEGDTWDTEDEEESEEGQGEDEEQEEQDEDEDEEGGVEVGEDGLISLVDVHKHIDKVERQHVAAGGKSFDDEAQDMLGQLQPNVRLAVAAGFRDFTDSFVEFLRQKTQAAAADASGGEGGEAAVLTCDDVEEFKRIMMAKRPRLA